ncbi:pyridine nucleotide-disulfide oxidoreductase-domain-containing protein [Hyaloraphidium curvatum]|nr:pyridine nucleotide-disulfide oxidoreductase-domain-containing protein [Hyaloraphidium curvatum]
MAERIGQINVHLAATAPARTLHADYAVVGCGIGGLAFADTLLSSSPTATVIVVDKQDRPGGHWVSAYPFVKLHQPSVLYGVASMPLGSGRIDASGGNAGMLELATGTEILAYCEKVVRERFLDSGRVTVLWMHEYDWGSGTARNLVSGEVVGLVGRKLVNTAHEAVEVPSMRPPPFPVSPNALCVPPNAVPAHPRAARFAILGTGKTAVDTLLWLLDRGADPDRITWIVPRDTWFENRAPHQPAEVFRRSAAAFGRAIGKSIMDATSLDDALLRLEKADVLFRLDPAVMPKMFHGATITAVELASVRRIKDIVRMGRVLEITDGGMRMDGGFREMPPGTLYVDCTAAGLKRRAVPTKVFDGDVINLRPLYAMLVAFSAALVAHVEVSYADEATKNLLCDPAPFSDLPAHYFTSALNNNRNLARWYADWDLVRWLSGCRLFPVSYFVDMPKNEEELRIAAARRAEKFEAEGSKMRRMLEEAGVEIA